MMKNPPHPGELLREDVIVELGFYLLPKQLNGLVCLV